MAKRKIAFVVAIASTAHNFLRDHFVCLLKEYDISLVANFASEEEKQQFEEMGVHCIDAPIQRKINIKNDLKALFALRKIFKHEKFECVHSVTPKAGLLNSIAGWMAGVPNRVHIFTGQVWATRKGAMRIMLKGMDKMIAIFDTRILVDGEGQRQFLIKEGILKESNSMVPAHGSIAGIKLDRFVIDADVRKEERQKFGIADGDLCFIFLGRLNHDKGIGEIYEAFNRLVAEFPNAKLLFYGRDEENYDVKADSYPNIKRNANFFYPGLTRTPFNALQAGDVFVLPTWREGFGVSVLEAQALALPVITSNAYGVVDASIDGVTGLRCRVGDSDSLYVAMKRYCDEPELCKKHGNAGRQRVIDEFDNKVVSLAWVDFYHEILK